MKRLIALSVVVVLVAACGSGARPTATTEPPSATTAPPTTTKAATTTTTTSTTLPPVETSTVLDELLRVGYYVEPDAPVTGIEADGVVKAGKEAGKGFYVVGLSRPPREGSTGFAEGVLEALDRGATVLVLTPEDVGWATNEYEAADLSEALDASGASPKRDADFLAGFVVALLAAQDTLPEYLVQTVTITNDMAKVMLVGMAQAEDPIAFAIGFSELLDTWLHVLGDLEPPDEAQVYHALLEEWIGVFAAHVDRLQRLDFEDEEAVLAWATELDMLYMTRGAAIDALQFELILDVLQAGPKSELSEYVMPVVQANIDVADLQGQFAARMQRVDSLESVLAVLDGFADDLEAIHDSLKQLDPPDRLEELHGALLGNWADLESLMRRLRRAAIDMDEAALEAINLEIDEGSFEALLIGIEFNEVLIEALSQ